MEQSKHSVDLTTPIDIGNSIIYNDASTMRAQKPGTNAMKLNDSLMTKSLRPSERNDETSAMLSKAVMTPENGNDAHESISVSLLGHKPVRKVGSTPLALKYGAVQPFKSFSNAVEPR